MKNEAENIIEPEFGDGDGDEGDGYAPELRLLVQVGESQIDVAGTSLREVTKMIEVGVLAASKLTELQQVTETQRLEARAAMAKQRSDK